MKNTKGFLKAEKLFAQFIRDKRYLANLSEETLRSYNDVWNRWKRLIADMPSEQNLQEFIVRMREAGLSVTTVNITIRSWNSFLTWLHQNGHSKHYRVKPLKEEQKQMKLLSDGQIKVLLAWKPDTKSRNEVRIFVLTRFLLDTGCRISESLNLRIDDIDFDNLLVTVFGKGRKSRTIPISIEMRKTFHIYLQKYRQTTFPSEYVFCTSSGAVWSYQNARRELIRVCEKLDVPIKDVDGFFHMFRRKFATSYVKHGGNLMYLQHVMGHKTLQMTKAYIHPEDEDLREVHQKTSILSRLFGKR